MAGALYDIHTVEHSWAVSSGEATGATIQDGVTGPAGERVLSAWGYVSLGGKARPMAIEKYEFGDIYGSETSEGCWARYVMEADVQGLGGTAYVYLVLAKETNPEA